MSTDIERNEGFRSACCDRRVTDVIIDGWGMCSECGDHCEALSEEDIERMEAEELAKEKP